MKYIEWIQDTKRTIEVLCCSLSIIYASGWLVDIFEIKVPPFLGGVILLSAYLIPFAIIVIIVTNNQLFKMLTSTIWSKSIIVIIIIGYTAFSNIWASTVINESFGVSASYFGITQTFLTLVFFVVTIMKWLFDGLLITTLVGGTFIFWFFATFGGSLKNTFIKITYGFVSIILISATAMMIHNIDNSVHLFAKRVATYGDFYPTNRCEENLGIHQGVIFLNPNQVMLAKESLGQNGLIKWDFPIVNCTQK